MSRVQLALNVSNLEDAIDFYSKFFKSAPAKVRAGYANFDIDEPPLKLVLLEGAGSPGSLNHLGVEVFSSGEVVAATEYLSGVGIATEVQEQTTCCYAVQDKVWVQGPDRAPWEVYTVLDDDTSALQLGGDLRCCPPKALDATTLDAGSATTTVRATACC
jgi:hypothetical protein